MSDKSWAWQLGSPGTLIYRVYDWFRMWLNHRLVHYLCGTFHNRINLRIMEGGSGPAFASSLFSKRPDVALSVATDIDIDALVEAHRRDPKLPVVVADLNHLPFVAASFDLTWNSSTLEHLENPYPAMIEMNRVTRVDGKIFVGVPFLFGPLGFQRWVSKTPVGVWIGTVFSRKGLEKNIRSAGLKPQSTIYYFFFFFIGVLSQK